MEKYLKILLAEQHGVFSSASRRPRTQHRERHTFNIINILTLTVINQLERSQINSNDVHGGELRNFTIKYNFIVM